MRCWLLAAVVLLPACGGDPPTDRTAAKVAPPAMSFEHDFGVIPHGESREHEFRIDVKLVPPRYVPLRAHLDCACGRADLRLRRADGTERYVENNVVESNLPGPDEELYLHVTLQTALKEAVDLEKAPSRGIVMLASLDDMTGKSRIMWPIAMTFGIDSPVELRPFAALDFGRVAASQRGELITTLRGDERHRDATFGPVECTDQALTFALEPGEGHTVLRATLKPGDYGSYRALVTVGMSTGSYRVPLIATWRVVPDLEATPIPKVVVRTDPAHAQTEDESRTQFVLVTDHDASRSPEFSVQSIVAADGRDLSSSFAVAFAAIANHPRQQRMIVRYTGGLTEGVRGTIVLGKQGSDGPALPIELVLFAAKPR